jgi:hypothetical protein
MQMERRRYVNTEWIEFPYIQRVERKQRELIFCASCADRCIVPSPGLEQLWDRRTEATLHIFDKGRTRLCDHRLADLQGLTSPICRHYLNHSLLRGRQTTHFLSQLTLTRSINAVNTMHHFLSQAIRFPEISARIWRNVATHRRQKNVALLSKSNFSIRLR